MLALLLPILQGISPEIEMARVESSDTAVEIKQEVWSERYNIESRKTNKRGKDLVYTGKAGVNFPLHVDNSIYSPASYIKDIKWVGWPALTQTNFHNFNKLYKSRYLLGSFDKPAASLRNLKIILNYV